MHNPFKFLSAWDQWQKQTVYPSNIADISSPSSWPLWQIPPSLPRGPCQLANFPISLCSCFPRVDHVISRKALGVWSEHTTLVTALKLSFVVIHLQWSNTACLTWIRGQKGALQGTCLVITFVLHCAKVSDRHSAAGGYNPTGFVCF